MLSEDRVAKAALNVTNHQTVFIPASSLSRFSMKLCRSLVSPSLAVKSREREDVSALECFRLCGNAAFPLEHSTPKETRPSAFPAHNNMPHFQLGLTNSLLKIIMNQGRRFDFDTGDSYFYHC